MTNRILGAGALLLGLAACGQKAEPVRSAATRAVPANEVDAIVQLLDRGERDDARKRVKAALKRDPGSAPLQLLRDSIERDPVDLLGPQSFPYTTRPGDTMIGLADRFLGNRLKAYQLARYNGIAVPQSLAAGQMLKIPGEPPRIDLPRKAIPAVAPTPTRAAPARPKPVAVKPVVPVADPAGAQRFRAAGLAALNAGAPARAVLALRRAAALDPGNPLVARDLARAERIAAAVRARRSLATYHPPFALSEVEGQATGRSAGGLCFDFTRHGRTDVGNSRVTWHRPEAIVKPCSLGKTLK